MISFRFYLLSLMMILVFFGLGILIGNSLGSEWMEENYQTTVKNLEKKLNQLSLDKQFLKLEVTDYKNKREDLAQAWFHFYQTHYGDAFKNRTGILLSSSIESFPWVKELQLLGFRLKHASTIQEITNQKADIIIVNEPTEDELQELRNTPHTATELVLNQKTIPVVEGDAIHYLTIQNHYEKDLIIILDGLYQLLIKANY